MKYNEISEEADPQGVKTLVAPLPGDFTQSRIAVDEEPESCKTLFGSPPGASAKEGAASPFHEQADAPQFPRLLGRVKSPVAPPPSPSQADALKHPRLLGHVKSPLSPPPGLLEAGKGLPKPAVRCEPSRVAMTIPPGFRPPPGLEHMVNLDCYDDMTDDTKQGKLLDSDSLDLSTDANSTCLSRNKSTYEMDKISIDDELDLADHMKPWLPNGGAQLRLDELFNVQRPVDFERPFVPWAPHPSGLMAR